jgi:chemotaxis protein histidine kinase CheA
MPSDDPHPTLDVVELLTESGRWPAGTVGTVVETDGERVLVEIADDRGHGLDFISLPRDSVAAQSVDESRAAS